VRPLGSDEIPCVAVVVIRFRDQYIGRLPMRQIKESLRGGGVYVGKRIELPNACVKAKVEALYDVDKKVRCQRGCLPLANFFRSRKRG
jgi:hypothetical protein